MKKTAFTLAVDKVVALKMRAIDLFIEQYIEPLADVGNPEKLIGKPYEEWTPQDLTMLIQIYGQQEPNPLSNLIFNREYDKVKAMEAEEEGGGVR